MSNVIELEPEFNDIYYKYLKVRGCWDFFKDFVAPGQEKGVRVDVSYNYPLTVVTSKITFNNIEVLAGQIRYLRTLA